MIHVYIYQSVICTCIYTTLFVTIITCNELNMCMTDSIIVNAYYRSIYMHAESHIEAQEML